MLTLKWKLDRKSLETMYSSLILSTMDYGNEVWGGSYDSDISKLEKIHIQGMRIITGATYRSNISKLYEDTGFYNIRCRCQKAVLTML